MRDILKDTLFNCPREGRMIPATDCPATVLAQETADDLAPCLACDYGRALAASCPFRVRRPEAHAPASERDARPVATPREEKSGPRPIPAPVRTMEDEIESLRNLLAWMLPKNYAALTIHMIRRYGGKFGLAEDPVIVCEQAGLKLKKESGRTRIMKNKAFRDFVKDLTQNTGSSSGCDHSPA